MFPVIKDKLHRPPELVVVASSDYLHDPKEQLRIQTSQPPRPLKILSRSESKCSHFGHALEEIITEHQEDHYSNI